MQRDHLRFGKPRARQVELALRALAQ